MANSLGGTIIFGILTRGDDKELPEKVEGIDPRNIESFDRILNAQVRPLLSGVRKKLIPNTSPVVMVVDIAPSDDPPHQSLHDHKYYHRSGTESLPMEHDLIALHFGRRSGPILDLQIEIVAANKTEFGFSKPHLRFLLGNSGKRVARHIKALVTFPPRDVAALAGPLSGQWANIDRLRPGRQGRQIDIDQSVIHPSLHISVVEFELAFAPGALERPEDERRISWTIYADEMQARSGEILLDQLAAASAHPGAIPPQSAPSSS